LPLQPEEVERLWQETIRIRTSLDAQVNIKCVSEDEMRTLNKQYRQKDAPTNVLTFSYPSTSSGQVGEHDIALCLPVAEQEAAARGVGLRDYVALLLVHAFLHAAGMDHERSEAEAHTTEQLEREILRAVGFAGDTLAH
jgi:probable rRNA maturation factor